MQFNDIRKKAVGLILWRSMYELEINAGYFLKPQNNCFQLVNSRVYGFITNNVHSRTIFQIFGQSITVRIFLLIYPCCIPSQDSKKV